MNVLLETRVRASSHGPFAALRPLTQTVLEPELL